MLKSYDKMNTYVLSLTVDGRFSSLWMAYYEVNLHKMMRYHFTPATMIYIKESRNGAEKINL